MVSQGSILWREVASEKDSPGLTESIIQKSDLRTSLVIQWLRLCASNAGNTGLPFGQGAKILCAVKHDRKKKTKQNKTKKPFKKERERKRKW